MMEYFDSGQGSDFSVSDVFESEVKSEIDELLSTETTPFAHETVTNMDLGTGLSSSADVIGLEITELQSWDQSLNTHVLNDSGLNGIDATVTSANNILDYSPDKYGIDSAHNIFVDPQTGLPSSHGGLTLGGTHIRAQQVNLFVNSSREQLEQQALLQQGLGNISHSKVGYDQTDSYGLQQYSHIGNGRHQTSGREFTSYQLQNGQGQTIGSPRKNGAHRLGVHNARSIVKSAKHQPYPNSKSHIKKNANITKNIKMEPGLKTDKIFPKPCYSYSCLITMALKNSKAGCLPVSEIYQFMCENFPYFKTAKDGWKNSVRHNLSLNKCFAKVETPVSNAKAGKKGCLWAMNPEKAAKMEEEVHKSTKRDPNGIKLSMAKPEDFPKIEALSRLTHPKNLKNAAKTNQRQSGSAHKRVHAPSTVVRSNNSMKAKTPAVTLAGRQTAVPVSLKKINLGSSLSQDLFHQEFNLLDPQLLSLDGDLGLQDQTYDTVEILPFDPVSSSTNLPTSFTSSSLHDTSPFKDNSQTVNSRLLGLDTSPITTLASTHYGLEQSKQLYI